MWATCGFGFPLNHPARGPEASGLLKERLRFVWLVLGARRACGGYLGFGFPGLPVPGGWQASAAEREIEIVCCFALQRDSCGGYLWIWVPRAQPPARRLASLWLAEREIEIRLVAFGERCRACGGYLWIWYRCAQPPARRLASLRLAERAIEICLVGFGERCRACGGYLWIWYQPPARGWQASGLLGKLADGLARWSRVKGGSFPKRHTIVTIGDQAEGGFLVA